MLEENWIFGKEAQHQLDHIGKLLDSGATELQILKRLRKSLSPEQSAQLLELHQLRCRGRKKFSKSMEMMFTSVQLEQATSEIISRYKALRFENHNSVADLCCGIGGDAIGIAHSCVPLLVDNKSNVLSMAKHNLGLYGFDCEMIESVAESFDVRAVDAFHLDPDRRAINDHSTNKRTVTAEYFSPGIECIRRMAEQNPNFALKIAPATNVDFPNTETEFIGHDRECKQQLIWSGELAKHPGVTTTVIDQEGNYAESFTVNRSSIPTPSTSNTWPGEMDLPYVDLAEVKQYLYAPHAALLAARMTHEFARQHSLALVDHRSKYMTSDALLQSLLTATFEVEAVLKPDFKTISQYLKQQDIGNVEIKKRDDRDELFQQLQKLRLKGKGRTTILMTDTPAGYRVVVANRIAYSPGKLLQANLSARRFFPINKSDTPSR